MSSRVLTWTSGTDITTKMSSLHNEVTQQWLDLLRHLLAEWIETRAHILPPQHQGAFTCHHPPTPSFTTTQLLGAGRPADHLCEQPGLQTRTENPQRLISECCPGPAWDRVEGSRLELPELQSSWIITSELQYFLFPHTLWCISEQKPPAQKV